MSWKLPGGELEMIGPVDRVHGRRLPLLNVPLMADAPALQCRGRRRSHVTMPGHRKGIKPPNAGRTYPPEPLTTGETLRLLAACPSGKYGVRNRALIALLWRTGLRVSEALALYPHHIDQANKRVVVLRGKGGKRRIVGIDSGGLMELQPWLMLRAELGAPADAPLFCTVTKGEVGNRLGASYVRSIFRRYGRRAGIPKRVHPHGLRHSLACDLIREGFSLPSVQAQLGHSSPATTGIYLRGLGADEAFEKVAAREWPGGAR